MKCPYCRSNQTEVYNTRPTKFANQIWRRRRCNQCHESFTTYEAADLGFLNIDSGKAKPVRYSRAKLYASINAAFSPAKGRESVVDAITDTVESKLLDTKKLLLNIEQIQAQVLHTLKAYDNAAFLRYMADHADLNSATNLRKKLRQY
jgi:transcriptional repressor NrdR